MTVSVAALAGRKGIAGGARELNQLQLLAFRLVVIFVVVIVIALSVAVLASFVWFPSAPQPVLPPNATPDQISTHNKLLADFYKQTQDLQGARFSVLGTTLVSTIFLPSLTLVLGYLFGKDKAI